MQISDLYDRYIHTIPFLIDELNINIMTAVWRDAVNFYNKVNPRTITESISVSGSQYKFVNYTSIVGESPIGLVDGVNRVFVLSQIPILSGSLHISTISVNGVILVEGIGYTISGTSLIFSVAPVVGSVILANYDYNGAVPDGVFRVYYGSLVFDNGPENLYTKWWYAKPVLTIDTGYYDIITGYNWTIDTIDLDVHSVLDAYIKQLLIIALGNKRRIATVTDLPIDGKGDQFVSDAMQEKQRLEEVINMLMPIGY